MSDAMGGSKHPVVPAAIDREDLLPQRLMILAAGVSRILSRACALYDLGALEWQMLVALGALGQVTANDLARHLRLHKTNVSRTTASLLARNFIERHVSAQDHRKAYLQLTASGRDACRQCAQYVAKLGQAINGAIAPEDRAAFAQSLAAMERVVEQWGGWPG